MFRKSETLKSILVVILFYLFFYVLIFHSTPSSEHVPVVIIKNDQGKNQENAIKSIFACEDKSFEYKISQNGEYWILTNYIRASHVPLSCGQTITYTTHGDYTFLENLEVLVPRWRAPISFAIYAPGYDFAKALESIQYVRNCLQDSSLIRSYVTFHLYFNQDHMPNDIPFNETEALNTPYSCSMPPPYEDVKPDSMYKKKQKLFYPINVGRNIARKAALTHLILASDVELYPSLGFVEQFLDMVMTDPSVLGGDGDTPRVFPLATFEINEKATKPDTKKDLQKLLKEKKAISFHRKVCFECHSVPNLAAWIKANETNQLNVFTVAKRYGKQAMWEPFYVSDNREPFFDERFTWEGKKNKRIQAYAMCLLDYEFHVLNNAFLIHKPGIKIYIDDTFRIEQTFLMNKRVQNTILPEYKKIYGNRKKCQP